MLKFHITSGTQTRGRSLLWSFLCSHDGAFPWVKRSNLINLSRPCIRVMNNELFLRISAISRNKVSTQVVFFYHVFRMYHNKLNNILTIPPKRELRSDDWHFFKIYHSNGKIYFLNREISLALILFNHSSWILSILEFVIDAKLNYDTTKVWKWVWIL